MRKWKLPSADGDQERNQSGNQKQKTKRVFGCRVARGMLALLCSAALVLSDALPVPGGFPEKVEAAGPSKGTISFYKWTRITTWEELDYARVMLIHKLNGQYYMSQSLKDINNSQSHWISKSIDVDPRIDPEADEFLTSTNWSNIRTRLTTFNGKYSSFDGYYLYEYYDDNWHYVSHTTEYLKSMTNGATLWIPYSRNMGDSGKGFEMRFGTINNNTVWLKPKPTSSGYGVRLDWNGWSGENGSWEVFGRSTKTFTCINKDYTIGENQVYVADSDLFLKENTKLTIPEGSVLCVKKGPFYVNGEIVCYGTILVEDGGIIMPFESTSGGSRIVMKEGGAMIIRSGGKVYAGCPKGSLGTQGDNGWLDMYAGSSIINFGLLIAGQCNFKYGQATLENHKGGAMLLGYTVETQNEKKFMKAKWDSEIGAKLKDGRTTISDAFGAGKTNGVVHYGMGTNQTIIKTWDGALTMFANKNSAGGKTVKTYSYDKDGKSTVKTDFSPN